MNVLNLNKTTIILYLKIFVLSIAIGIYAVFFARATEYAFKVFMHIFNYYNNWLWLYVPAGFLGITYCIRTYFPEAKGSGIPQALAISHIDNAKTLKDIFHLRAIFSKFFAIVAGTFFGATIGREGPTVQVGATIMSLATKNLTLTQKKSIYMIGAAAGLASAFNTPLGGIIFALEELFKFSKFSINLMKLTAIATSGICAVLIAGNYSYFGRISHIYLNYKPQVFLAALIIGIIAGACTFLFSRIVIYTTISPTSFVNRFRMKHPYLTTLICALLIVAVGCLSHGLSYGNGYHESKKILAGQMTIPNLYFLYKMFSSILSTCSGVPGGYFATSLSIGEGIGNCIFHFLQLAPLEQCYLLGMVAFLAGLTQAPITAITMVLQVTITQTFTLPLIVAALSASIISSYLGKGIYEYQIQQFLIPTRS